MNDDMQMRYLEDRIKLLESTVTTLRENGAAMKTLVDVIHTDMKDIKVAVNNLAEAMNRGRGGIAMLMTVSTTLGGMIAWAVSNLLGTGGQ